MTTTSMSDPMVGRVLDGRYEILAKLARGGMATVYRAQDRRLRRTVAVKVMHDGLGDDAEFARKFDREARSAATLSNPHVVSVFDQGVDSLRPYIVMEFVQGCTLRHVITRQSPLPPLAALEMMENLASALASAHEAGLVHRDVKPENVLISDRGQVKVADFGLARAVSNQTATATQGLLIGTVSYLPPELVTSGRADSRSDVYSAGVVLFEMLTGKKPHSGETPIQVAYSHVHNDIPAPSTLLVNDPRSQDSRRIVPPYLDALVMACTRREPERRPRDGRELLHLVRVARKALGHGILDDPALTTELSASMEREPVRPVPAAVPAQRAADDTVQFPAVQDGPPRSPGVATPAAATRPPAATMPPANTMPGARTRPAAAPERRPSAAPAPQRQRVRHVEQNPPRPQPLRPQQARPGAHGAPVVAMATARPLQSRPMAPRVGAGARPVASTAALRAHQRMVRRRRAALLGALLVIAVVLGGCWWLAAGQFQASGPLGTGPVTNARNASVTSTQDREPQTAARNLVDPTLPTTR